MEDDAQRQVGLAADIVGTATGVYLELRQIVASGTGSIIGTIFAGVLKEAVARASPRQEVRIDRAVDIANDRIRSRLMAQHIPRTDGFFEEQELGQSTGGELLESALVKVSASYQEKKIRHIGLFYANLIFADYVSLETAHMLLSLLERMSYRQLAFLALLGKSQTLDVEGLRRPTHHDPELSALKQEEMALHGNDLGTLGMVESDGLWGDKLSTLGKVVFDLAGLSEFNAEDLTELGDKLAVVQTSTSGGITNSA